MVGVQEGLDAPVDAVGDLAQEGVELTRSDGYGGYVSQAVVVFS
jgi:hypothetical protein